MRGNVRLLTESVELFGMSRGLLILIFGLMFFKKLRKVERKFERKLIKKELRLRRKGDRKVARREKKLNQLFKKYLLQIAKSPNH